MPDVFTKKKRSEVMSKIRSKGSKIELKLKKALEEKKVEFEYQPRMFGKPDFLVKPNIAVFCDSSFWHGRNWKALSSRLPSGYWYDHIKTNRLRDREVNERLKKMGFIVLRFWDTAIEKNTSKCVGKISNALKGESRSSGKAIQSC
jgi:DNA mismatch endonuclease (patch repair protein)